MIVPIRSLFAARHALAARSQHLARILFPDPECIEFFFELERAILNQFVGRRVMRLRVLNFVDL